MYINNFGFTFTASIGVTLDVTTAYGTLTASTSGSNANIRAALLLSSDDVLQVNFENTSASLGDFDVSLSGR